MFCEAKGADAAGVFVREYSDKFLLYSAGQDFFKTESVDGVLSALSQCRLREKVVLSTHIMHGAYAFFDSIFSLLSEQIVESGQVIHCSPKCSHCCKQIILSNPFEAALIGIEILGDSEKQADFEKNYKRWDSETRVLRDKFSAWIENKINNNVDDGSFNASEFVATCPFLIDDLCQVYRWRPYGCRSYLALSEMCKYPVMPTQIAGRQGIGVGMSTTYHNKRMKLLSVLWEQFGINSARTRGHFLPDLVKCFLDGDMVRLLNICLL